MKDAMEAVCPVGSIEQGETKTSPPDEGRRSMLRELMLRQDLHPFAQKQMFSLSIRGLCQTPMQ